SVSLSITKPNVVDADSFISWFSLFAAISLNQISHSFGFIALAPFLSKIFVNPSILLEQFVILARADIIAWSNSA
ncbi:hypothetical protein BpHYR1_036585, partial [Brachionus plicatilis]